MLARRPPESAGRGGRGGAPQPVTPFLRRIGLRVLTEPFSVTDTPSLREFGGRPVPGSYAVDDYGIRAKDVTLVEKGRLVTLLTGRTPLKGLLQSTGHTRGGDVQPSVVQIQSSEPLPAAEVRTQISGSARRSRTGSSATSSARSPTPVTCPRPAVADR